MLVHQFDDFTNICKVHDDLKGLFKRVLRLEYE